MATIARFVDSIGQTYPPVTDTFTRVASNGWGTSDSGHVWVASGGNLSEYSVSGNRGVHTLPTVNVSHISYVDGSYSDASHVARVLVDQLATGAAIAAGLVLRRVDDSNFYLAEVRCNTDQTITVHLFKVVAGVFTELATVTTGSTHSITGTFFIRFEVVGSLLRARVWSSPNPEPAMWDVAATATEHTSGDVAMRSRTVTGNTNTNPTVRYDDLSIAPLTSVRLDLNDGILWRLLGTSRFDPPRAKRARVSTLLTDGAIYPASAYDDRMLELRWLLQGDTTDIVNTEIQKLGKELNRPSNVFEYRPEGATESVFFRTHRLGLDALNVPTDGTWVNVEVNVPAEPFGYGLPQVLPAVTVANDPAAASNGMFLDVANVQGDVETPLLLRADYADVVLATRRQSVVAVRRRGDPTRAPFALQCEAMTQGTDTTVQANSALMSGAGSNFTRTTFATVASNDRRLYLDPWPTAALPEVWGTYRVYLRYRHSVAGDVIKVQLRFGSSVVGLQISNAQVALGNDSTAIRYADLGLIQFPTGAGPDADSVARLSPTRGMYLAVHAERTSGTGNLDEDVLLFVPADDQLCIARWPTDTGPTYTVLDGDADATYLLDADGALYSHYPLTQLAGGLPMVSPGVTNRVYWVLDTNPSSSGDAIANTVHVAPSYLPRYLHVRPVST